MMAQHNFQPLTTEQSTLATNRELIPRMEKKIQATLARVWGEEGEKDEGGRMRDEGGDAAETSEDPERMVAEDVSVYTNRGSTL